MTTRDLLAIADTLKNQTDKMFSQPPWQDLLLASLVTTDREHGCLRSAQILRDHSPDFDADKAVFMVMLSVEEIAMRRCDTDAELLRIRAAIAAAEKAAGVGPDDEWEDAPPEVGALYEAIQRRETELEAEVLREYGETELAGLRVNDYDAYLAKREPGRLKIYGPVPELDADIQFYFIVGSAWDTANKNPDQQRLLRAIDAKYGTKEDEDWPDLDDQTPADILELRGKMETHRDQLIAAVLRKRGKTDMADSLEKDSMSFWERYFSGAEKAKTPTNKSETTGSCE